jgi:hypothetical protein
MVKIAEPVSVTAAPRARDPRLNLYVLFTDLQATRAALLAGTQLARDLNARLVLIVAKIVPYPLPLESPPVATAFTDQALSKLAASQETDVVARVYLCRDRETAIRDALAPRSLVMIGRRKRFWPDPAPGLARLLERDGHQVILVRSGRTTPARIQSI